MNGKRILRSAVWAAVLLAGCKDPSERFEGPGGARLQPVVHGGTRFADDPLSIPVEAMAASEDTEPQILRVELYADGERLAAPPELLVQRWHGTYGYGQTALFTAPPGARALKAVLFVHHLTSIFEMEVPFELDPASRATNKWIMGRAKVRLVGATVTSRQKPRAAAAPG
jgi:hypothetical protein